MVPATPSGSVPKVNQISPVSEAMAVTALLYVHVTAISDLLYASLAAVTV